MDRLRMIMSEGQFRLGLLMLENCVKVTFSNLCELVPLNHDCPDGKPMKQNASTKEKPYYRKEYMFNSKSDI